MVIFPWEHMKSGTSQLCERSILQHFFKGTEDILERQEEGQIISQIIFVKTKKQEDTINWHRKNSGRDLSLNQTKQPHWGSFNSSPQYYFASLVIIWFPLLHFLIKFLYWTFKFNKTPLFICSKQTKDSKQRVCPFARFQLFD